jgi:uncharacterized protein YbjT (DUF2867 family)
MSRELKMANERVVLITGATGKQGGATARALKGSGFALRAMTRNPDSDAAKAVAAATGADIVEGDLNDAASIRNALKGVWGVFAVQNTWEAGVEGEEEQGKRLASLSREAGVQHYVYTSVGSAHRKTGIPHFDNKYRVEDTIRAAGFPSYVIFRPVFFMENLTSPWFLNGDAIYSAMRPDLRLQMIAVDDIGKYVARGFTNADKLNRREIDLAADEATMPDVALALSRGLGRNISYVQIPISEVRKNSDDFATMLEWFDRVGYDVDIPSLEREFGMKGTRLTDWAVKQRV